tara:strand:- start:82 stop:483 length:402 start_codon:yes stop_codon:yes gene_type:complete
MDIDKSLYMSDFLRMRQDLGTVELYPVKNILFTNLYNEMTPKVHSTEVVQAIEEINKETEKKTIMVLEGSQESFTPIEPQVLPELFSDLLDTTLENPIQEVKKIHIDKEEPEKVVEGELKQIVIDPKYIAKDN